MYISFFLIFFLFRVQNYKKIFKYTKKRLLKKEAFFKNIININKNE
nr:MAG TPA: hypothetical protein [Caudoviricetes sp.]